MKILITGSNGFIGTYLCSNEKRLSYRKAVRSKSEIQHDLADESFHIKEFSSTTDWTNAFKDIDAVLHLAAVNNNQTADSNIFNEVNHLGTLNLATQATKAGVKRFVFVSSSHVNGSQTHGAAFNESTLPSPHGEYAQSKFNAEKSLTELAKQTGLEVVIIRPTLVYGPGASNNSSKLIKLVSKLPMLPFGMALKLRSFISVKNLTDFIYTCLVHPDAKGEIFLIADSSVSIKEFTNKIAKGLNKKLIQIPVPIFLFNLIGKITGKSHMIDQIFGEFQVDTSKAKKLLGWKPVESMEQTMKSLKGKN